MYFCEFSEIPYLADHLQMAGPGFCTTLYVSFHNLFHQAEQEEWKFLFYECIQKHFNIGELSPKEIIRFKNATYIFFTKARLEIIH